MKYRITGEEVDEDALDQMMDGEQLEEAVLPDRRQTMLARWAELLSLAPKANRFFKSKLRAGPMDEKKLYELLKDDNPEAYASFLLIKTLSSSEDKSGFYDKAVAAKNRVYEGLVTKVVGEEVQLALKH